MSNWFINRNGSEDGPFTPNQLKQLATSGQLHRDTPVRREDKQTAVPAAKVTGLFPSQLASSEIAPAVIAPRSIPESAASLPTAGPRPQPAASSGVRTLIIALGVAGSSLVLLCCGGLFVLTVVVGKQSRTASAQSASRLLHPDFAIG
jgi:hypothetical protein